MPPEAFFQDPARTPKETNSILISSIYSILAGVYAHHCHVAKKQQRKWSNTPYNYLHMMYIWRLRSHHCLANSRTSDLALRFPCAGDFTNTIPGFPRRGNPVSQNGFTHFQASGSPTAVIFFCENVPKSPKADLRNVLIILIRSERHAYCSLTGVTPTVVSSQSLLEPPQNSRQMLPPCAAKTVTAVWQIAAQKLYVK